jgi:putative ABC transport system permease protein
MTSFGLAWRSTSRDPLRAVLAVAGVAAVGALLFDMLLLSRGLIVSFRDLLDSVGYDVRVTASEALPTLGPPIEAAAATAARIRGLPEVDEVVILRVGRAEVDGRPANLVGSGARARGYWTITRGEGLPDRPPAAGGPHPALLTESLALVLGAEPGSVVRVRGAETFPEVEMVVVGIGRSAFDAPGDRGLLTSLAGFEAARGGTRPDEADVLLIASRAPYGATAAVDAIRQARPDLHPFSNEQFLSRLDRTDFSYFRHVSTVLSTVTLLFACLLVATLLTVSVNQRLGEVAALRALGFSRRRVVADLLWESVFLVGIGGTLSVPAGAGLAVWLDGILTSMPGLPERLHFFVFEPRVAWTHAALLALTAVLAAAYPVWLATTLPIAATLRREVVS